jgi:hypothetical protein
VWCTYKEMKFDKLIGLELCILYKWGGRNVLRSARWAAWADSARPQEGVWRGLKRVMKLSRIPQVHMGIVTRTFKGVLAGPI